MSGKRIRGSFAREQDARLRAEGELRIARAMLDGVAPIAIPLKTRELAALYRQIADTYNKLADLEESRASEIEAQSG